MATEFERRPIAPDAPLQPGKTYELVLSPKAGDLSRITRADLEQALRRRYPGARVLDWGRRGGDWVVRLRVEASSSPTSSDPDLWEGSIYPAYLPLPAILTAAAVVAILYLVWRIVSELKEAVELVPAPARGVAVAGAGIGVGALGLAALGVVALSLIGGRRRR